MCVKVTPAGEGGVRGWGVLGPEQGSHSKWDAAAAALGKQALEPRAGGRGWA